jgi:hypothetical protein
MSNSDRVTASREAKRLVLGNQQNFYKKTKSNSLNGCNEAVNY